MVGLRFYNTYSKKIEDFIPMKPGVVKLYTCGPTVYSHPHIGNFKAYVFCDLLKRFLKFKGYKVTHIMNITDAGHLLNDAEEGEDKIEEAARKENKNPLEIAQVYVNSFMEARDLLNIEPADHYPRVTDHINEMIDMIKILIDKNYAYVVGNNVYYDVTRFKNYGKLSGNTLEDLNAGARIEINSEKKNPHDFALWKHDPRHLQQWDSPWGKGFPGWHIECSAMSSKYLGKEFDIHTGGPDNIFPHHECEIAQSEAANDRKFVHYWLHNGYLNLDGEKMSKSKGNLYTIQELVEKGFNRRAIRYSLLSTHYRQPSVFSFDGIKASEQVIYKIEQFVFMMKDIESQQVEGSLREKAVELKNRCIDAFDEALSDDLNISKALSVCFEFMKEVNKLENINSKEAREFLTVLTRLDEVLGVLEVGDEDIPEEIQKLAAERNQAKKAKDFTLADELRKKLLEKNYIIEDKPGGHYRIKKRGGE